MDMCGKIQQLGKGIGSPARYKLLEALMNGPKTVNELVGKVNLSQPAVSQHLSTLKDCRLVDSEKKGQEVYYSLNAKYILSLLEHLSCDVEKCSRLRENINNKTKLLA